MEKEFPPESEDAPVPDFSGDDFGHLKWIQEQRKEHAAFQKMMNDSMAAITGAFNAKASSHKNLKHFEIHKEMNVPMFAASYQGSWMGRPVYFCVLEYETSVRIGRSTSSGTDHYLAGMIGLSKNYPHTIVHPETVAIRIENLFTRLDVDFVHAKKFSRTFHVMCKDKNKLELLLLNKDLDTLADHGAALFELKDDQCYFRASKMPVCEEEADNFVRFTKALIGLHL